MTLDSIWFSYNGNEKGKLNPYAFKYHSQDTKYNPSHNIKHYDRWGNYKDPASNPGGMNNVDFPYAEQDSINAADYAAAWHLSDIQLPSGGKIKITYEADDYAYVQYKRAANMTKMAGFGNSPTQIPGKFLYSNSGDNYYVFFNTTQPLGDKSDIRRKYLDNGDTIYFKISVKMPSDKWGSGHELVPVYASVEDFGKVNGNNYRFWIKLKTVDDQSPVTKAAIQFLRLNIPSKAYPSSELGDDIDLGDAVRMLASGFTEIENIVKGFDGMARIRGWCKEIDTTRSFARLTDSDYKKYGGGLRVKRIEIFDNWNKMTNQKEAKYGQEYFYTTSQAIGADTIRISSGVATYEPMIGAEENPFRTPIEYAEKLAPLAPVNYLFSENPVGETFYPSAMVGYSKVRIRTLHIKAKSVNGWEETEFFTSRDFPTIVEHTLLDDEAKKRYNPKLNEFLRIKAIHHITLSQGFKVELNDMNGKLKAQATYAETDSLNPIHYVRNFYKVDNDRSFQQKLNNTVWVIDSLNGHINKNGQIGKDIEVMMDMREQLSRTNANNHSANIDLIPGFGIVPVIPIPSLIKLPQREETRFRSAATVKIVQRYGILDSLVVIDKGSVLSTKNLVYDGETGAVILSRTNNEFNDPIYNFSYPAHWSYSGMGMAYKNIDAIFTKLKLVKGKLYYGGTTNPFPSEKFFESGDEIKLVGNERQMQSASDCLEFMPTETATEKLPNKIWAISASKGKENHQGTYFIDSTGKAITGEVESMQILRSGKRNMLDASIGSIISMANPVKEVSAGNFRIVFDTTTKVLNASAVTYKDIWKVANTLYQTDSCYTKIDTVTTELTRTGSLLMRQYRKNSRDLPISPTPNVINAPHFTASVHNFRNCGGGLQVNCSKTRTYRTKSILQFNVETIPVGANIISATLDLDAYKIAGVWQNNDPDNLDWSTYGQAHYRRGGNLGTRTNASILQNVFSSWNAYTPYNNVVLGGVKVNVPSSNDATCDNKTLNVTSLIEEAISIPKRTSYGMMIQLADNSHAAQAEEMRTLSFCGNSLPGGHTACETCLFPNLEVVYSYSTDTCVKICRSNINDSATNPYRWGLLGNWRMDRAYTYYHDRQESDAAISNTDIRKEGLLKNFSTYWKFTDSVLLANADTTKWVWNSTMSSYNRKGFETENYDPLGRYNSGRYGYNHALPVAIAQNSKYREMLFDGFEDYGYKTNNCTECDSTREYDFVIGQENVAISTVESHSGKSSIKVNAGAESKITVPVFSLASDTLASLLSIKVDSTPIYIQSVVGKGIGLTGEYRGYSNSSTCPLIPSAEQTFFGSRVDGLINFYWGNSAPMTGLCHRWYDVAWKGKLQAPFTDYFNFYVQADAPIVAKIGNTIVASSTTTNVEGGGNSILLEAGKLYDIEIRYSHAMRPDANVKLRWSRREDLTRKVVEKDFLYPITMVASDTVGSVIRDLSHYCIAVNNTKPQNLISNNFSPYTGSKVVASGWVKIDGNDCNDIAALDGVIVVGAVIPGPDLSVSLQKTGVRIEGWQRYESVITIPANATQLSISLKGVSGRNVYVDDVRFQPFNSNMKSFVYDPVSLRLMAELDENNYASFYEYDDDGTLIRMKKETERGIMTIRETRSALIKDNN